MPLDRIEELSKLFLIFTASWPGRLEKIEESDVVKSILAELAPFFNDRPGLTEFIPLFRLQRDDWVFWEGNVLMVVPIYPLTVLYVNKL